MIDPATGWFEVKAITNPDSASTMDAFFSEWLCRYPRPNLVGYDNGSEFKKYFKEMCINYGLKSKPSTAYNPQSNGMIERVHQVLGNALRTFELDEEDLKEEDPWMPYLSAAA